MTTFPINDLAAQRRRLGSRLDNALARVLEHGAFIMGPEVTQFEQRLAAFCGARHVISCANGTDALILALRALGVGAGQAVLVPAFTFAATAEAVMLAGATPVFVDVQEDSFNIDPSGIPLGLAAAAAVGLRPTALIAVDLFGQPADYESLSDLCKAHGLTMIADAAQSFGAEAPSGRVGTLASVTTTSFFPAKPLGCYGDGGALFTNDSDLAAQLRSLRMHGQGSDKYDNVRVGMNSRLDTLQAAILLEKLDIFPDELQLREQVAQRYEAALSGVVQTPKIGPGRTSAWAQYTLRIGDGFRNDVKSRLADVGIQTAIYYSRPLHRQPAYSACPVAGNGLPVSETLAAELLSIPMHPYLSEAQQDYIAAEIRKVLA